MEEQVIKLVKKAQAGNADAFEQLVHKYHPQIYNLALKILQNPEDARDVAQDTFLAAWEKIDSFNFKSKFYTWLYRIATNFALMKIRRNKKSPLSESDFEKQYDSPFHERARSTDFTADRVLINAELKSNLQAAINDLPEIYRAVFVLRDMEGVSIKETADILGITESNVKIRLKRARIYLKEYLDTIFSDRGAAYELS